MSRVVCSGEINTMRYVNLSRHLIVCVRYQLTTTGWAGAALHFNQLDILLVELEFFLISLLVIVTAALIHSSLAINYKIYFLSSDLSVSSVWSGNR